LECTGQIIAISNGDGTADRKTVRRYGCRALKRWPLGTSYTIIVDEVAALVVRLPLANPALVVDATGVGRPVVDMFREASVAARLLPVTITGGQNETWHDGVSRVAKTVLISTLLVVLQQRRLQVCQAIPEVRTLIRELQNYRLKITAAMNETFNAREGEHDDLILALALAAWEGESRPLYDDYCSGVEEDDDSENERGGLFPPSGKLAMRDFFGKRRRGGRGWV
jgi:hypothetical protein